MINDSEFIIRNLHSSHEFLDFYSRHGFHQNSSLLPTSDELFLDFLWC